MVTDPQLVYIASVRVVRPFCFLCLPVSVLPCWSSFLSLSGLLSFFYVFLLCVYPVCVCLPLCVCVYDAKLLLVDFYSLAKHLSFPESFVTSPLFNASNGIGMSFTKSLFLLFPSVFVGSRLSRSGCLGGWSPAVGSSPPRGFTAEHDAKNTTKPQPRQNPR